MTRPSLAPIVRAMGGDLWAGGVRANVPGPGHGPADRSVSLWLKGDRVIVHAFAGEDWRDVMDDLRRRGLVSQDGRLAGGADGATGPDLPPAARRRCAIQLWSEGVELAGTLSARHLARRGVAIPVTGLRHHPAVPAAVYAGRGQRRPALLAAIREDTTAEVSGVEVTYLDAAGARAALAVPRKTIGLIPYGSAVRLAPAAGRLLVGEGVFTCLSASAVFGLPPWALLSAWNLRAWSPPPQTAFVLIAADRGVVGEASARALARRLRDAGVACAVRFPKPGSGDWNDALLSGAHTEGRAGGRSRARRTGGPGRRPGDPDHDPGRWPRSHP